MGNKWLTIEQRDKYIIKSYQCNASYKDKLHSLELKYLGELKKYDFPIPKTELTLHDNTLSINQMKISGQQLNTFLINNPNDIIILKRFIFIILNSFLIQYSNSKTKKENLLVNFGIDPSFSNFIVSGRDIYYVDIFPPLLIECISKRTGQEINIKDMYSFLLKFIPEKKYLFLFYTPEGIIIDIINHILYYTRKNAVFSEIAQEFYESQYYSRFHRQVMYYNLDLHKSLLSNYLRNKKLKKIYIEKLTDKLEHFYAYFSK